MKNKKQAVVTLDKEQARWLESKIDEGYSKSGLIRYAIKRLMEEQNRSKLPEKIDIKPQPEPERKLYGIDIKSKEFEELISQLALNEELKPDMLKIVRALDYGFKNIKYLDPDTVLMLGAFKGIFLNELEAAKEEIKGSL